MAITRDRKPPATGPQMIGRALRDLRGRPDPKDLLGGANLNLSQPLPVFRLGLDELVASDSLSHAKQVGWRYLIERADNSGTAYADVRDAGGGAPPKFTSLSQNRNAVRLVNAAHLAQVIADDLPGDCEARVLDVPALYTSAIWLTCQPPVFIPYIDPRRLGAEETEVHAAPDFVAELLDAARIAREHLREQRPDPASP
jgi:hypothetical protein